MQWSNDAKSRIERKRREAEREINGTSRDNAMQWTAPGWLIVLDFLNIVLTNQNKSKTLPLSVPAI